jgi:hypothetical protein
VQHSQVPHSLPPIEEGGGSAGLQGAAAEAGAPPAPPQNMPSSQRAAAWAPAGSQGRPAEVVSAVSELSQEAPQEAPQEPPK